ncbi:MAG TPA: Ig-like domain repeat protein [Terracidiphilus sp.]
MQISPTHCAGILLGLNLLAITPAQTQQTRPSFEPPASIISLSPSPRPQGEMLARRVGDATFAHAPSNYHVFAASTVGADAGVETLTLKFASETKITRIGTRGKDFVVEPGGTCHEGSSFAQGQSCSLLVRFNPQGPGHRLGSIHIAHTAEATPMFVGLTGNGYSPVVSFTPSQITTVAGTVSAGTGTIKNSTNLAEDGGDNLYIPDVGNSIIKEIDSSGAINTLTPVFAVPQSIVGDSSGFLYSLNVTGSTYYFSFYAPWGSQSAYGTTYAPGACTPSAPCPLSTVGMGKPANINIDPYDNLFFEDTSKGAAEMPVASLAAGSGALNLWYLTNQFTYTSSAPAAFGVDGSDNLYNFYNFSTTTCYLQEEPLYNAEYSPVAKRVAGGVACGFSGDGGQARSAEISTKVGQITFDVAGNLYFTDAGNQRVRRIDAATGIISTIAGSGTLGFTGDGNSALAATLANPSGLAVDSQGQVYILSDAPAAGTTQVIRRVGVLGYLNTNTQLRGTAAAAKLVTVANTGNSALTLSSAAILNGTNPGDFTIDSNTTTCDLTSGATLAAGHSCKVGVIFKPLAAGVRSAYLVLHNNTVNGSNRVFITGTGTLPNPTMTITAPTNTTTLKAGTAFTFSVNVTSTTTPKPTGTVTFKVNGTTVANPVTLASGVASTSVTEFTAGTYTLSAVYSGDANFTTFTVTKSATVTAVKTGVKVSLLPTASAAATCGPMSFSIQVSSAGGAEATGTVALRSGTALLGSASLNHGAAMVAANGSAGSNTFVATYGGDNLHLPGTSAPITMKMPLAGGACGGGRAPVMGIMP